MLSNLIFTSFVSIITTLRILSIILPPNNQCYSLKETSFIIVVSLLAQTLSIVWFMVRKEKLNNKMKNIVLCLMFVCLGIIQACEKQSQPTTLDASVDSGSEVSVSSSDASSEQ